MPAEPAPSKPGGTSSWGRGFLAIGTVAKTAPPRAAEDKAPDRTCATPTRIASTCDDDDLGAGAARRAIAEFRRRCHRGGEEREGSSSKSDDDAVGETRRRRKATIGAQSLMMTRGGDGRAVQQEVLHEQHRQRGFFVGWRAFYYRATVVAQFFRAHLTQSRRVDM